MNIVFLGAGNLAFHLAQALHKSGNRVVQIYSRTLKSAKYLANLLSCDATNDIQQVTQNADLYIIAVVDDAISYIADKINIENKNIVHTAGSISIDVLQGAKNYGVFYPLQTFSKNSHLNFSEIPICVEADNDNFRDILLKLANQISNSIWQITSYERQHLHLAAVFVCNFVNHIYSITENMMNEKNLDFKILKPLIQETVNKALTISPKLAQTGPAVRNDKKTMKNHSNLLISQPDLQKIYDMISQSINKFHNN